MKQFYLTIILFVIFANANLSLLAQVKPAEDSFFLLKKKGWLKKLGQSIYVSDITDYAPVKAVNPFEKFKGKVINSITVEPTGFYTIVRDTVNGRENNFGEQIQDFFHVKTYRKVISKNLFFKVGDKLLPILFSDNERFLREQTFLQDAMIDVKQDSIDENAVHVFILSRDIFSIGASVDVSNSKKAEIRMQDENLIGTGNRLEITGLFDKERSPNYGFGTLLTLKNLGGTFINCNTGIKNYSGTFNTGRQEETSIFANFDKQLISRYTAWMGAAVLSYNKANNFYKFIAPDDYDNNYKYTSLTTDLWAGLNIGYKNKRETDNEKRLRHFVAVRSFANTFFKVPDNFVDVYNPGYTNVGGALASYTLYKQNFYNTNFIYGFGRKEDIPQGLSATIVSGYTIKNEVKRPYYGAEFEGTKLSKQGDFVDFTFKLGSFLNEKKPEDAVLQIGVNGFSRLNKLRKNWRNRKFIGINFTRLMNTKLGFPIVLESESGLPYFNSVGIAADTRTVLKFESVYFNLKKIYGFRLAPFFFTDLGLVKAQNEPTSATKGYPAFGGGLRTRNEHLVFGTIEIKGYYFPRVDVGVKNWKVELSSKLIFRYRSNFLRRPDFVNGN